MIDPAALRDLHTNLQGHILHPDDPGFDKARRVFNGAIDKFPLLIINCACVKDVIHAINFARKHQLPTSIRGNGHSVAGNAVCDDGFVIDLSHMKAIQVDSRRQIAQAQAGLTWGEFDQATQQYGLATTGGTVSTTGISGLTLGGGMGWLLGKYGLSCDNVLSIDVVTVEGELLTANTMTNKDLFWALRGGGGNFGVATSFTFQLHPLETVLGGTILYPLEKAPQVLRMYRTLTGYAPDDLTANISLLTTSAHIPALSLDLCYTGPQAKGERLLKMLEKLGPPLQYLIRPLSYCELQRLFDHLFPALQHNYWKSSFLYTVDDEAIDTIVTYFQQAPSKQSMIIIEHFHGMAQRVQSDETAFGHRDAHYSFLIASIWSDSAETDANISWTRSLFAAMAPFLTRKVYVNYLDKEGPEEVKAAYGPKKYERLARLKQVYDPTNFFRLNQNISPAIL